MTLTFTDQKKQKISLMVLAILHLVGMVGLLSPFKPWIMALTPVHLILCSTLLLWGVGFKSPAFKWWFILVVLIGYGVEVAGVKTGLIFGQYHYGETLGFKIFDVPVIIGLNWFLVSYGAYSLVSRLKSSAWIKIMLASLLCVGLDVLIEPVAINLDYWQWENGIPIRNYVGWFGVSLIIQFLAFMAVKQPIKPHPLAVSVYFIQFAFFLLLNLFAL